MLYISRSDELPVEQFICAKDKYCASPVVATVPYKGFLGIPRTHSNVLRTIHPDDYFLTESFEVVDPYSGNVYLFAHRAQDEDDVWIAFWCPSHKRYTDITFNAVGRPYFIPIRRRSIFINSHYIVVGNRLFLLRHTNNYYSISVELIEQSYADISHIYDVDNADGCIYRHWVTELGDELIMFVDNDMNPFHHSQHGIQKDVQSRPRRCSRMSGTPA